MQVSIEYGSKFESFKTTIYFHKGIEAGKVSLQYKRKMKWKSKKGTGEEEEREKQM